MILKSSLLAAGLLVLLSLFGSPAAARGALVGGMFADCRGARTESPTVILEAGAFGTSADWDFVLAGLAASGACRI